jgi:hypothetical protein
MKQIFGEMKKPFTSSLNGYPEACCRKGWGGWSTASPSPSPPPYFPSDPWIFHLKDDVTIILLLCVSFMGYACPLMAHSSLSTIRCNYNLKEHDNKTFISVFDLNRLL